MSHRLQQENMEIKNEACLIKELGRFHDEGAGLERLAYFDNANHGV